MLDTLAAHWFLQDSDRWTINAQADTGVILQVTDEDLTCKADNSGKPALRNQDPFNDRQADQIPFL